jgi:hypothetical protein
MAGSTTAKGAIALGRRLGGRGIGAGSAPTGAASAGAHGGEGADRAMGLSRPMGGGTGLRCFSENKLQLPSGPQRSLSAVARTKGAYPTKAIFPRDRA